METTITKQDLRVGNYIRCSRYLNHKEALDDLGEDYTYDEEWLTDTVVGICHPHEDFMYWSGLDEEELMNRVDGIPLSEKWLKELGFEETAENSEMYFMDDFSNFRNIIRIKKHPTLNGFMFVARDFILCTLEHVHQLQNLYHALTANELKREEKNKRKS